MSIHKKVMNNDETIRVGLKQEAHAALMRKKAEAAAKGKRISFSQVIVQELGGANQ